MTRLELKSETYAPLGGIDGKATIRAMGKPGLGFWDLFLRETLQNSWDARLDRARGTGTFSVDAFTYESEECDLLLDQVFSRTPIALRGVQSTLRSGSMDVLVVSDSGTRGLGGPVRADVALPPGTSSDFVDFVRNVGRDPNKAVGGGTYGFGKAVLYQASSFGTCVIYSQALVDGIVQPRFIVMSVGDPYDDESLRYTGRHWWGKNAPDGVLDPVIGEEALALARRLGLDRLDPASTGTSIAILGPVLADDTPTLEAVVRQIARAIETWAWPHMIDSGFGPSIQFSLTANHEVVELIDSESDPLFEQYVRAFEHAQAAERNGNVRVGWPWCVRSIDGQRPKRHLGTLAYRSVPILQSDELGERRTQYGHHVALMRDPKFVVKYLAVPEDETGQATVGVFVAAHDANEDFASTEPVAHDDWVPDEYEGETRANPVRIALKTIINEFRRQSTAAGEVQGANLASGTAMISRLLGTMLSGGAGLGAETLPVTRGAGRAGSRQGAGHPIEIVMDPYAQLAMIDGDVTVDFGFTLQHQNEDELDYLSLEGVVKIVLEGGVREKSDEAADDVPEFMGWYAEQTIVSTDSVMSMKGLGSGHYSLRVKQRPNTAITASIRVVGEN